MSLVLKWFRPPPLLVVAWVGPTAELLERARREPAAIAALVGPPGDDGEPGNPGPPGPGVGDYDPGDITLDFYNALI